MWVWIWGLYRGPCVHLAVRLCLLSSCLVVFVKTVALPWRSIPSVIALVFPLCYSRIDSHCICYDVAQEQGNI